MRNFPCKTAFALAVSMLVCGCGTTHKLKFEHFTEEYKQGEFCKATDTVLDEKNVCNTDIEKFKPADFNIDEQLNAGTSLFLAQKHELSESLFEKASSSIQEDLSSTGIARGTVEVVGNASMLDYNPMIMDGIYLHSYTFLNALSAENKDDAKIQINRAYNFQQNAVNAFSKEIEKEKADAAKEASQMEKDAKVANDKNISDVMANYKQFAKWKGYSNFVNPYVTYISGLYFMTNGTGNSDYENASNYMKRVHGMVSSNTFVKDDLAIAEKLAQGNRSALKPTAWVVFENGLVARFKEFRLDLPIFIATDNVKTASLALPYPEQRDEAFKNIAVSNGKKKVTTETLADIDNIFIAEFHKKLPTIVAKAVTKLALQTAAQAVAQDQFGDLGGIAAAAYSVMTAGADTRSWYSLPKNVQLAKVAKNGDKITLYIGDKNIDVNVPENGNSIVYVRTPSAASNPVVEVFNL